MTIHNPLAHFLNTGQDTFEFSGAVFLGGPIPEAQEQGDSNGTLTDGMVDVVLGFDSFMESLAARGIDTTTLTEDQIATFEAAASTIATAFATDFDSSDDALALFDDDANISLVDDLSTTDGTSLNGAAILGSDEILLDSSLTGLSLRDALIEEVAETAYQKAFGTTSVGDFGAEILARTSGETDQATLNDYATSTETDTVETSYGTAEAQTNTDLQQIVDAFTAAFESQDIEVVSWEYGEEFSDLDDEYGDLTQSDDETVWKNQFDQYGYEITGGSAISEQSEQKGRWSITWEENGTVPDVALTVDTSEVWDTDPDDDAPKVKAFDVLLDSSDESVEIISYEEVGFVELDNDLASTRYTIYDQDVTETTVLTDQTSFSTTEEWNWSASITGTVGGFEASAETGGSLTSTDEYTTSSQSRSSQYIAHEDAEYGETYAVGLLGRIVDITVQNDYSIFIDLGRTAITNNDQDEGFIKFNVSQTDVIEDYFYDITATYVNVDDLLT